MNRDQRLAAWLEGEPFSDGHEELLRDLSSDENTLGKQRPSYK
jgi:hypothetical protein